jgi:hypothetical protein
MGFFVVLVAVFELAESDRADGGLYEAAQLAELLLETGFQVAPELVLLGLQKISVSLDIDSFADDRRSRYLHAHIWLVNTCGTVTSPAVKRASPRH